MKLDRAKIYCDAATLAALVYTPDRARFASPVVLAHGLTASKESMDLLANYLCGRGHICVTFDFRGHKLGASAGDLTSAEDAVRDLARASEWARERFRAEETALVGHSMGALIGLVLAMRGAPVEGVVSIATGLLPSRGFRGPIGQALMRQRGDYLAGVGPGVILSQMDALADSVADIGPTPALLVAARSDVLMKPSRVAELARRAGPTAELVEVDAGHLDAADAARGLIAAWLGKRCALRP